MGAAGPRARPRGCAEPGTGEGRAVTGVRGPGLARGAGWCPQTSAAARSRESLLFGLNGNTCPAANVVLTQLSRDAGHCKQGQNRGMGQGQPSSALRRPLAPPCAPRRGSSPPQHNKITPGTAPQSLGTTGSCSWGWHRGAEAKGPAWTVAASPTRASTALAGTGAFAPSQPCSELLWQPGGHSPREGVAARPLPAAPSSAVAQGDVVRWGLPLSPSHTKLSPESTSPSKPLPIHLPHGLCERGSKTS